MKDLDDNPIRAMYGDDDGSDKPKPKTSSYVDHCIKGFCNMIDEDSDKTTVVPRGVAKRLDPDHFANMDRDKE